jgi:WhiB family redox-sensing transcriptional regulator
MVLIPANDWKVRGACRGADPAIFLPGDAFDDVVEEEEPSAEALAYCNRCVVAADCLTHALAVGEEGIWGGTTSYQRRQLKRPLTRVNCPVCGAQNMNALADAELCINCGASWRIPPT